MFAPKWLQRLADEAHGSERLAARWHLGHAIVYGVLIVGYICMGAWHLAAAERHHAAAIRKANGPEHS